MELGINYTAWPEMLAWPYLILQGWLPYRDIGIAHNPLLIFDLVVFYKLFGVGIIQLKIYTWLLIGLNTYLTYFVATKFWNKKTGFIASILYLLLCFVYEGNGLWFDLALVPFALLLFYFVRLKKYLWSGVIFALGFFTKQTFIWFLVVIFWELFKDRKSGFKNLKNFVFGNLVIAVLFLITLFLLGILPNFFEWSVQFGIFYLPSAQGQVLMPTLKQFLFAVFPFLITITNPWSLVINFMLVGMLGVYPRFELFHFQPALPFLAVILSNFILTYKGKIIKFIALFLFATFVFLGLKRQLGINTRFYEPEVVKTIEEIKKNNSKEIYVINYWDSIYTMTNTYPVTKPLIPYIPWYLEYKNNKDIIISSLKLNMPQIIVLGQRDSVFPEIFEFVEKYYSCNISSGSVELCYKNK